MYLYKDICLYKFEYIYVHLFIYIYIYIYICVCVCVCVCLPNPPHGQDVTLGQFLNGVQQVWIQGFPSPRLLI